jgi:hypothetical protein
MRSREITFGPDHSELRYALGAIRQTLVVD